jgi:hypothetical protein
MTEPYDHRPNNPNAPRDREGARRKALNHFAAAEKRDTAIKQELARERAATDAKTAKLRALRLAKEETDRETARVAAETAPPPRKTRAKKAPITVKA